MATDVRNSLDQLARDLAEWRPDWEATQVFPVRYPCTEEEYLALHYNVLLEYDDGFLEVLPMPTIHHQRIVGFLYRSLYAWVTAQQLGEVLFAPLRVKLRSGKFREPDVLYMEDERAGLAGNDYWERPSLVMEVVSESNRRHDLVTKRGEYARAVIPEYWIVDPEEETITVFILKPRRKTYLEHGNYGKCERAESTVLPGFGVDVAETFSQVP